MLLLYGRRPRASKASRAGSSFGRELQNQLKAQGVEVMSEADERTTGPASFMVMDPDGNPILIDQHV